MLVNLTTIESRNRIRSIQAEQFFARRLALLIDAIGEGELDVDLDEAFDDLVRKYAHLITVRGKNLAKRAVKAAKKAVTRKPKAVQKRPKTPVPDKGKRGGTKKKAGSTGGGPAHPEPSTTTSVSRPRVPEYPPEVRAKVKAGMISKNLAKHPANWATTSVGAPVKALKRPKPPIRPEVSVSKMYQHVVRAIYNRGKRSGYQFKNGAAKSSQEIAREKMVKWGYASASTGKGGVPDARRISLSGKGKKRSRIHAKEPAAVLHAKSNDYAAIVGRDPL